MRGLSGGRAEVFRGRTIRHFAAAFRIGSLMRPTVVRRVEQAGDAKERARRIATILAAGFERLLAGRQEAEAALDSREDQSVTTDYPTDGSVEESDGLGD